jgi:hypothetical protein
MHLFAIWADDSALTLLIWCDKCGLRRKAEVSGDYEGYLAYSELYMLKSKLLACLLLVALIASVAIGFVNAQTNYVAGTISTNTDTIVVHDSVTITCTYTSTASVQGSGSLWISGPASSASDSFDEMSRIKSWSTLSSGVPVDFTRQLDATGYYKFTWMCEGGGVNGAWTYVIVNVVDTPTVLPEAPSLAVFALGFAALGLFVVVTKKRSNQQ